VGAKDTLRNVRETGEFVVSITTHALAEQVNRTSARFDRDVNELIEAGLTPLPLAGIAPVGVAEAPIAMPCRAVGEQSFGPDPRSSVMVFGEVLAVSVAREVLAPDGMPDPSAVDAVSRLGREEWARLGTVFTLPRPD
jgi:flavin reductase (DIM6/NTAB) family NADH-FMN oxidoreductase RutF